jgi:MFS family permease
MTVVPGTAEISPATPGLLAGTVETRASWWIACWAVAIFSVANCIPYSAAITMRPIALDLGTPRWVPALANSLIYLGTGVGGVAMGRWADRIGVRWTALFGGAMMAIGAVVASVGSVWSLYLGYGLFIGLLGFSGINSPVMIYVSRWFDRRRGTALALVASGQYIAGALCPPILNASIERFGWRTTVCVLGIAVFVLLAPMTLVLRRPAPALRATRHATSGPTAGAPVLGLKAAQVLGLLSAAGFCCCVSMSMPLAHLVAFCGDIGYGAAQGANMLAVLLACAFVSRQFWGLVADRLGGLSALVLGSACQAIGLLLFSLVDSLGGLFVVAAAFGFGFSGLIPNYLTTVRELFAASEASWRMPTLQLFTLGGMAAGTWLAGWIFDITADYRHAFAIGVAFNLVNLAIVGALALRRLWLRQTRFNPALARR